MRASCSPCGWEYVKRRAGKAPCRRAACACGEKMYHRKSYKSLIIRCSLISACMALCGFFVYFPLTDTDIFWHLAAGREIFSQKRFLFFDPFAYSLASPKWIDLHWLFQVVVYGLYSIGNEKALLVFKLLSVAGAAGILCAVHRSMRYVVIASFLTALLFWEARYLMCLRPVLITVLCMATYFYLFENAPLRANKRILWLCIPLQILWTNSQGLYMIGLFIIGAYWLENIVHLAGKKEKIPNVMILLPVAAVLSCMVNPYGVAGLQLPFSLINRINPDGRNIFSAYIAENIPLFSLSGYDAVYRSVVVVTALIAVLFFVLNRKEIRIAHYLLFAGFGFLAVMAERNVLLYIVCVIPIIGYHASRCAAIDTAASVLRTKRRWASILGAAALLALLFAVVQHSIVIATYPPHRFLSPFRFPEKISEYLKQNPYRGKIFNDIRYGGYLIWNFYPQKQVFIDGRLIIRPREFFRDYLTLCADPDLFAQVARKFDITQVVLPWAIFTLHRKLIQKLYESEDWRLEYTDGASTLFVRKDVSRNPGLRLHDQAVDDVILDSIGEQWKNAPYVRREAMGYFSEMLDSLGLETASKMVRIRIREWDEK